MESQDGSIKKKCCRCKKIRLLKFFGKNKNKKDGLQRYCKDCSKLYREKFGTEKAYALSKEWHENHRQHFRDYRKQWYEDNKYKWNDYVKKKRQEDIYFRLVSNLRGRITHALKWNEKENSTLNLLGCSPSQLKNHLESQFTEGMMWNNYGRNGWEVDHIKPCASFDFNDPEQQRQCFHYSNLQPLWKVDNIKKSNKT